MKYKMRAITITEAVPAQTKTVFEPRLSVFRVRANFAAPYRKCKYFYIEKADVKTKTKFIKRIEHIASSWPNGTYFLKMSSGVVFARFDAYDGKVRALYKDSPVTGKLYLVWNFFKK